MRDNVKRPAAKKSDDATIGGGKSNNRTTRSGKSYDNSKGLSSSSKVKKSDLPKEF